MNRRYPLTALTLASLLILVPLASAQSSGASQPAPGHWAAGAAQMLGRPSRPAGFTLVRTIDRISALSSAPRIAFSTA